MKRFLWFLAFLVALPALGAERLIINPDQDGDIKIKVNDGGTVVDAITVTGSTGASTIGPSSGDHAHKLNGIHTSSGVYSGTGNIRSGVYGPTTSALSNVTTATHFDMNWSRVGNLVFGGGNLTVQSTATGASSFNISLPVASNFTSGDDCSGSGAHNTASTTSVLVSCDTTNDTLQLFWIATATTSSTMTYAFSYEVK